ncbi:MAG: hypothetical protein JWN02_2823 [Acidobacteria bacterium]|nr:hypothetical protein [Acidobacteriota bacterium]
MHDEENRLLQERLDQARRANITLFAAGALLVLVCAALLFLFLRQELARIDEIYLRKVDESERARRAEEGLAQEVQEQAAAMEQAVLMANRERDAALRALSEGRPE